MGKVISRIPLSGGPKAGKSVIKEEIRKELGEDYNCKVIVLSETATELIKAGIIPESKPKDNDPKKWRKYYISNYIFQFLILVLQKTKEWAAEIAAKFMDEDVIILYDRSILDNEAYLLKNLRNKHLFPRMLAMVGLTKKRVMKKYSGIIFLETSAAIKKFGDTAEGDDTQRLESDDLDALLVDKCLYEVQKEHPYLIKIPAMEDFGEKTRMAVDASKYIVEKDLEKDMEKGFQRRRKVRHN